MGNSCIRQKQPKKSNKPFLSDDEIYNEEARDAVDFVLEKKFGLQTCIELTISCQNLPKVDSLTSPDPKVVCYVQEKGVFNRWSSTEVIPDSLNPYFQMKIMVPFYFEKPMTMKFEIYDVDEFEDSNRLEKQDLIGHVTITLHEIVCSPQQTISKDIIANITQKRQIKKCGVLIVSGEEIDESRNKVSLQVSLSPFSSKSDSKLELIPFDNANSVLKISELRPLNKKGVDWNLTLMHYTKLYHDNSDLRFKVLEMIKNKKTFIGDAKVNISEVLSNGEIKVRIKKNASDVGDLKMRKLEKINRYTFLNYIDSGAEISLIVGIDFTKSNREPTDPRSLHYSRGDYDNEYLQALKSLHEILQYYNSENKIPSYGFGAKLSPYFSTVSNCFALNGKYFDPDVNGLEEVMKAYKGALSKYQLHDDPTSLCELIRRAAEHAKAAAVENENQKYSVLLILTDGDIDDLNKIKEELVNVNKLPMSIIIIGVGDEDFSQIEELVDESPGIEGLREIIQFVRFSKYKNDLEQLANNALEEVPKQFLAYMKAQDILPMRNCKKPRFAERIDGEGGSKPSSFLIEEKERFMKELLDLKMDPKLINWALEKGVPAPNVDLVDEMISIHNKRSGSKLT